MKNFSDLEKKLGLKFKNINLLIQAHVHRSYLNENPKFPLDHNERLEFLGDAVLEMVITDYLFRNYKNPEGELTSWRAALVNSRILSKKARKLGLEEYLYLSKGEQKDIGRAREIILANTFEALLGAIYLDLGLDMVREFVEKNLLTELPLIIEQKLFIDPKSQLQEIIQQELAVTPTYQVMKEWGPDHARHFIIGVFIDDQIIGQGEGPSKQLAQIEAAKDALKRKQWEK